MITKVSNKERILRVFFEYPEKKFHLRELARLTGLSGPGVIKIVKKLKAEGLLKSEKERMVELVEPNFDGSFTHAKRAYNLTSMYNSGLVKFLEEFYEHPLCIVLFGSYADGSDKSGSDIDLAIDTPLEKVPSLIKFEKVLKRKINMLPVEFKVAKPGFKNSLANGMVLSGFLEVVQ